MRDCVWARVYAVVFCFLKGVGGVQPPTFVFSFVLLHPRFSYNLADMFPSHISNIRFGPGNR